MSKSKIVILTYLTEKWIDSYTLLHLSIFYNLNVHETILLNILMHLTITIKHPDALYLFTLKTNILIY